jgi:hypothetical protein
LGTSFNNSIENSVPVFVNLLFMPRQARLDAPGVKQRIRVGPTQPIEISSFIYGKWPILWLKVLFLPVK